jgi:hypothetical protein
MLVGDVEHYEVLRGGHGSPESRWDQLKGQRKYLPLAEGQSIGIHGGSLASTTSDVGIAFARQSLFCLRLQLIGVLSDGWQDVVKHALRVDFILICAILAGVIAGVLDPRDVLHGLGAQAGWQRLWWAT